MTLPSQDYLKSRIDYNPQTGEARWKPVDESYGSGWKIFNGKCAGKLLPSNPCICNKTYTLAKLVYKIYYNEELPGYMHYKDGDRSNVKISNLGTKHVVIPKTLSFLADYVPITPDVGKYLRYNHKIGTFTRKDKNVKKLGSVSKAGYRVIKLNGQAYRAHRIAWFLYYGVDPGKYLIDHIDGVKNNNCISNLRLSTFSLNTTGSYRDTQKYAISGQKFTSDICVNNVNLHLGTFDTEAEARQAYEAALQKYKPIYQFTPEEQAQLDQLYNTYPNCSSDLQHACHELQVKALNYYVDAAIVQTPKN